MRGGGGVACRFFIIFSLFRTAATAAAAAQNSTDAPPADLSAANKNTSAETARNCEDWNQLFDSLNHYFRDDDLLQGSEHSSIMVGYAIVAAYSIVIAFGAIGNLLTIAAVLRSTHMRTVRNFFILNLALSDFFICTVTAPITLYTVMYMFWPFGTALCKIVGSLQGFNIFLSTFSIAAIALDRYVLVIFPTQRDRQKNLALLFFLLIWLISILLALPLFVASDQELVFSKAECGLRLSICHEQNQRWRQDDYPLSRTIKFSTLYNYTELRLGMESFYYPYYKDNMAISKEMYTVGVLFIQYAFPLASIVFAYSRIARRMGNRFVPRSSAGSGEPKESFAAGTGIGYNNGPAGCHYCSADKQQQRRPLTTSNGFCNNGKHSNNNNYYCNSNNNSAQFDRAKRSKERYRRTNFLLIAVVCVFAAAWLPLNIFHLINTFHRRAGGFSVPAFALCHCLAIGSACLNPLSYAFFNHHFRAEFAALFRKLRIRHFQRCFDSWPWGGGDAKARNGRRASRPPPLTIAGANDALIRPTVAEPTLTQHDPARQSAATTTLVEDDVSSLGPPSVPPANEDEDALSTHYL